MHRVAYQDHISKGNPFDIDIPIARNKISYSFYIQSLNKCIAIMMGCFYGKKNSAYRENNFPAVKRKIFRGRQVGVVITRLPPVNFAI